MPQRGPNPRPQPPTGADAAATACAGQAAVSHGEHTTSCVRHAASVQFDRAVRGRTAHLACADDGGVVAEVDRSAPVEDVERALPEAVVAVALAVAHDAALELVDLAEAAARHEAREHLAADAAGAVGHDRAALELVVLAGVEQLDEVAGRLDVGHDRAAEPADRGLERIASVEEHDVVAALGHELVQPVGRQPWCRRPPRRLRRRASSPGAPNETISSRTLTTSFGKSRLAPASSRPVPSLHLKSMCLNAG